MEERIIKDINNLLAQLFQKMHEAGYEWDAERKELKKIEQKSTEWHREDEQNLNACLGYIPDEFLRRWLTDIIHTKYDNPAWGEEDENIRLRLIDYLYGKSRLTKDREDGISWLKSLKERYT